MSFPETCHAITIAKTGGPEVVEKTAVPFPHQKPNEVLIKVVYGGVNTIDTYFRKGLYPIKSFPQILGVEGSGIIVRLPTDESILNNEVYKARRYKVGGRVIFNSLGAFSEYVSFDWNICFPLPDGVSLELAAASYTHGMTVITFMNEAHNVQAGETILIHTVAGGLGLLFTAYAKSRGATVIGTTSTAEKAEIAKSYGADHVILYTKENTVERVLELTGGQGVHAVFDGVGKDTFEANFDLLRRKGTLVSVGNASGPAPAITPLKLSPKNLKLLRPVMGNYLVTPEEAQQYTQELFRALQSGLFKIRISNVYGFTAEDVQKAQIEITTPGGKLSGKLLIKIGDE